MHFIFQELCSAHQFIDKFLVLESEDHINYFNMIQFAFLLYLWLLTQYFFQLTHKEMLKSEGTALVFTHASEELIMNVV
jgi:hypothetical protein